MNKFKESYNIELSNYLTNLDKISKYQRLLFRVLALFLGFFFISAPLAILINLLLFTKYYYIIALGISFLVMLFIIIQELINFSFVERKTQNKFIKKHIMIANCIEAFVLFIVCYIILIIIGKVVIL